MMKKKQQPANRYPIYIVSKGRADKPLTARALVKSDMDFKIVVEPQEADAYSKALGEERVLVLPFENKGLGSYPARNFCWQHAKENGHRKHWVLDDNIYGYAKWVKGKRIRCDNALRCFTELERFADAHTNIGIIGHNYRYFAGTWTTKPFYRNTHVYSSMLIDCTLPFRWRLKYNEDVDLCLQLLHDGQWATVLVNMFLANKVSTSAKMKGGNQDELYKGNAEEKKIQKAASLRSVWPQYVEVTRRYGRPHHHIAWQKHFKAPLLHRKEN